MMEAVRSSNNLFIKNALNPQELTEDELKKSKYFPRTNKEAIQQPLNIYKTGTPHTFHTLYSRTNKDCLELTLIVQEDGQIHLEYSNITLIFNDFTNLINHFKTHSNHDMLKNLQRENLCINIEKGKQDIVKELDDAITALHSSHPYLSYIFTFRPSTSQGCKIILVCSIYNEYSTLTLIHTRIDYDPVLGIFSIDNGNQFCSIDLLLTSLSLVKENCYLNIKKRAESETLLMMFKQSNSTSFFKA